MRVACVGVGKMGLNHCRVLQKLGHEVITIDPDPHSGARYRSQVEAPAYDAAVIACPIEYLEQEARTALLRGADVMVEKPFAETTGQAESLISLAASCGHKIFVGYTEVFNPVLKAIRVSLPLIGDVLRIEAQRFGFAPVNPEIGPMLDLMVHDLAVVRAVGFKPVHFQLTENPLCLTMDNHQQQVVLSAGYGDTKIRTLSFTGTQGVLSADYIKQSLTLVTDDGLTELPVSKAEPLVAEWEGFFDGRGFPASEALGILHWLAKAMDSASRQAA